MLGVGAVDDHAAEICDAQPGGDHRVDGESISLLAVADEIGCLRMQAGGGIESVDERVEIPVEMLCILGSTVEDVSPGASAAVLGRGCSIYLALAGFFFGPGFRPNQSGGTVSGTFKSERSRSSSFLSFSTCSWYSG